MTIELQTSFSSFFKCLCVCPCECGYIHEDTPFSLSHLLVDSSADGALVDDECLAVDFPGLKVGQIHLYSSFVTICCRLL
jgi:hypothetical protein